MLRSLNELMGYRIDASDGELGSAKDFFFDELKWATRYIVVDTGKWLPGRKVLISPASIERADWAAESIKVDLTRDQIKNSPPVDTDKPVSQQMEGRLTTYYGWPVYWDWPAVPAGAATPVAVPKGTATLEREALATGAGDPHLHSVRKVCGYHIEATDGSIGHVEDFVADDDDWAIRYLVVDTRNWLPGRRVLVAPQWINSVSWSESAVHVDMTKEAVKGSPQFDPAEGINRGYEMRLYDYYGRPFYW